MLKPFEILFVDYNEAHAQILREALAAPGAVEHRLRVARTGAEALDFLFGGATDEAAPRPDLVLLNLDMPVVSGLDVLGAVKANPGSRSIPIIVLARSPRPEDVAQCYARGANSVVVRPVPLGELTERLRQVVRYWAEINTPPPPGELGRG